MDAFESAVDTLYNALAEMRSRGVQLKASTAALQALAQGSTGRMATAPSAPVVAAQKAPEAPSAPASGAPPAEAPKPTFPLRELPPAKVADAPRPAPPSLPPLPPTPQTRKERLAALKKTLKTNGCAKVLFGSGNPEAELVFIGARPTAQEMESGDPYVGEAGTLLGKIIEAMGFKPASVYHLHLLPAAEAEVREETEALDCLRKQLQIIQPQVLVALGPEVLAALTEGTRTLAKTRGEWLEFEGRPLMPTVHPQHLVENPELLERRKFWEDMLAVLRRLNRPISPKQRGFFQTKS